MTTHPLRRLWRPVLVCSVVLALLALASPLVLVSVAAPATVTLPAATYDWLQFNGDAQHSGNNSHETAISRANVATLTRVFRVPLPEVVDSPPVYLHDVSTPSGTRDLLFATTRAGHILALDAHSGDIIWSAQHGPGDCRINRTGGPCYTTAAPAIDPNRQYVYTYGLDGYVHRHAVSDGHEVTGSGWPQLATLKPWDEKGSAHLTIATLRSGATYLYVANGGYPGDRGDYQGHVTAINLGDGSQHVFNANCSDLAVHLAAAPSSPSCPEVQSAIWARAGVVYDAASDRIYAVTGNGTYAPASHHWGDSVLALNANGTAASGGPLDSYTPTNYQQLEDQDADLGSTAPAILPVPSGSKIARLAVQSGKDGVLRLLDLDNLSQQGGPGHTGGEVFQMPVPQGGGVLTTPAVWSDPANGQAWVFVANGSGISGLRLVLDPSGNPRLESVWQGTAGGTSPLVANGILYYAGGQGLRALNPTDGSVLWADPGVRGIHWESPIVAGGMVYLTDEAKEITAYAPSSGPQRLSYLPLILKQ